ncbi:MAG: sugar transferase [Candidatus Doudnabacteria bacterium]|nr:sugar transferase [Candidatus Doudnabacteria bacterium]
MQHLASQKRWFILLFQVVPAIVFWYIALALALLIRYPSGLPLLDVQAHVRAFTIVFVLWLLSMYAHRLFEWRPVQDRSKILVGLVSVTIANGVLAIVYFYAQPTLLLTPRRFLALVLGFSFLLLVLWYGWVLQRVQARFRQAWFVLGRVDEWQELAALCAAANQQGIEYKGRLQSNLEELTILPAGSVVVVPEYAVLTRQLAQQLFQVRQRGVLFVGHTQAIELLYKRVPLESLAEQWFLQHVSYGKRRGFAWKRVLDLVGGLVMGMVFALTFPFIALGIRVGSAGPVLFRQRRVGYGGVPFTMYKYRTMQEGIGNTWTADHDPRITRFGALLRRLRLDELPQSINILNGTMSLVGPRPEQVHIVEQLRQEIPFYDERHVVKPGLTGWAQLHVYAASIAETKEKLSYDLYYVKHQSVWFDLEILLKTVYMVLAGGHR